MAWDKPLIEEKLKVETLKWMAVLLVDRSRGLGTVVNIDA